MNARQPRWSISAARCVGGDGLARDRGFFVSGSSEMILEATLEYDPGAGTSPFHVILRISRTADWNGVRTVVLIEKVLDREIKREIPRRLVLSVEVDQVEAGCRRVGRRNVPIRRRRRPLHREYERSIEQPNAGRGRDLLRRDAVQPKACLQVFSLLVRACDTDEPEIGVVHRLSLEALNSGLRNVLVLQERQNGNGRRRRRPGRNRERGPESNLIDEVGDVVAEHVELAADAVTRREQIVLLQVEADLFVLADFGTKVRIGNKAECRIGARSRSARRTAEERVIDGSA